MIASFTVLQAKLILQDSNNYYYSTEMLDFSDSSKKLGFLYTYEESTMKDSILSKFMGKDLYMPIGINFSSTMSFHSYIENTTIYTQIEGFKFSFIPADIRHFSNTKKKVHSGIQSDLKSVYGSGSSIFTITIESVSANVDFTTIDIVCADTEIVFRFNNTNRNIYKLLNTHINRHCEIKVNNLEKIVDGVVNNCTLCNLI
jgi:hypothetical protein